MRLKTLKLAGFKSFVDPTPIPLPGQLTAIVGPNGCGKSNTIDAVRWVMGESSAKHLRGESMTDVIFNGSSSRKPVGQASVELVFDNSDGRLGGEYAKYSEIAIKRTVNRDSQSNYYLNNVRCRRKDIKDVLHGTGLGSRSYSIIEQGTISRLIEAKPEDLRIFLEDAAGISKYKERRRETENRIKHTRENLERLNDIIVELDKHIERLDRQSKAAQKYKIFREEERLLKAQLLALRWQALNEQMQSHTTLIQEQEVQLESFNAETQHHSTQIIQFREKYAEQTDAHNAIQTRYYSLGNEVARLEEAIAHQREKRQQLEEDLAQADSELSTARQHFREDQENIDTLQKQISTLEPQVTEAQTLAANSKQQLSDIESEKTNWQQQWDAFNAQAAESSKAAHVEQTRIQQLEKQLQSIQDRITHLQSQETTSQIQTLETEIETLGEEQTSLQQKLEQHLSNHQTLQSQQTELNQQLKSTQAIIATQREALQQSRGRHASLEALQQAALGKQDSDIVNWLEGQGLADNQRLAQGIKVEDAWQRAAETVLGDYLQAVCTDNIDNVVSQLTQLEKGQLTFIDTQQAQAVSTTKSLPRLADVLTSSWLAVESLIANIYLADSVPEAMQIAKTLAANESVVCREGIWLGNGWVRVACGEDQNRGILQREQELKSLLSSIDATKQDIASQEAILESLQQKQSENETQREEQQQLVNQHNKQIADLGAQLRLKQGQVEQLEKRTQEIKTQLEQEQAQLERCKDEIQEAKSSWQIAMSAMDEQTDTREKLVSERDSIQKRHDDYRDAVQTAQHALHNLQLALQSAKTQFESSELNMQRMDERIQTLEIRREGLAIALAKEQTPDVDLDQQLQERLTQHQQVEQELKTAREAAQNTESLLQAAEDNRSKADQNSRAIEAKLQQLQVDGQSVKIRAATIEEQLQETDFALQSLLDEMPEEANESGWDEKLQHITARITRLGAINLAAIEEFKLESDRKTYLDAQFADLSEALETLETAIRKIDRETRTRFKETYDKVNERFTELFPQIFGGGRAYLELTGDDLLDTGVTVMAQPPGKRNSSIHLLSGGEKAMTAVALVFAIFHLNPSPFCMLDEVDAPLDDANVTRFCNLVSEMSKQTQFIFITHNKITMEMATHLAGVTMHEPGVSRIVAVDIDEAVTLAEA